MRGQVVDVDTGLPLTPEEQDEAELNPGLYTWAQKV